MISSNLIRFLIIIGGCFLLFTACPRPVPIMLPPPPVKLSKEEILKFTRENFPPASTLRSGFKASIEYPQQDKSKKTSFEGAVLFRKDKNELRLQSFGIFGNTLFDILYHPEEALVYIPSSAVVYQGDPQQLKNFHGPDIFPALQEIIMGMSTYNLEDWDFNTDTFSMEKGELTHLLKINRTYLWIEKKTILKKGGLVAEILYQDYKKIGQNILPTRIIAFFPQKKTKVKFELDSPRLNEELEEKLFTLALPPNIHWVPLSQLNDLFFEPGS